MLDTNIVSELRRVKPHGAVLAWIQTLRPEQIFISAVTIGELQTGVELTRKNDPAKANKIEDWLNQIEASLAALAMDSRCFREWARLMVGRSGAYSEDAMIAATGRVHGLVVATRDERDFRPFQVPVLNPFQFEG